MRFLSICSGIEAASVAFHPLGWQALAFAEIEPFPCSLLAHHYPQVPNLGDLTRWREWSPQLLALVEVLCGGTPCQAFSVAGLRGSLSDERGNLTLTFCHLFDEIDRQRHLHGRSPAVCLWENVPGVLNTPDNAFGHFLAGLAGEDVPLTPPGSRWTDAGYVRGPRRAVAWRVLDAQYFGLAQRRERVFVVASADPAFDPAAVLFELDGLRRDTPPRRGAGEGAAPTLSARTKGGGGLGTDAEGDRAVIPERVAGVPEVAGTLNANGKAAGSATQQDAEQGLLIPLAFGGNNTSGPIPTIPTIPALNANRGCHNPGDFEAGALLVEVAHALRAEGFDAGEDGTGRGTPIVPIAFPERLSGTQCASEAGLSPVLQSRNPTAVAYPDKETRRQGDGESFAFDLRGWEGGAMPEGPHATANLRAGSGGSSRSYVAQKAEPGVLPFDTTQITSKTNRSQPKAGDPCHPLAAGAHAPSIAFAIQERAVCENPKAGPDGVGVRADDCAYTLEARQVPQAVAFTLHGSRDGTQAVASATDTAGTIREGTGTAIQNSSAKNQEQRTAWRVRRLTPEECEMLQGFPIGYTLIPGTSSKKRKGDDLSDTIDYLISLGVTPAEAEVLAHSPDGPRYKALGNSWAVPVARWIARRIDACTKALSRQ